MSKTRLAAITGIGLLTIAPGHAADLGVHPIYTAPPPAAVVLPHFSWTGCYIGGHIGGGWGSIPDLAFTAGVPPGEPLPPGFSIPSATGNTSGVLGGAQVGCNYQFAPNWVIGIEGDASAADIKGRITGTTSSASTQITGTADAKTDWLASATGRLGWVWDRWLIYGKGGLAGAGDKYSASIPIVNEQLNGSETRIGWTLGGGIEWAFWNNWSAKVEYDFYDFGTRGVTLAGTFSGRPTTVSGVDVKQTISAVKFGINYRFGWEP
jgi:outer membrane immunogenic protein